MRSNLRTSAALISMTAWVLAAQYAAAMPVVQVDETEGRTTVRYQMDDANIAGETRNRVVESLTAAQAAFKVDAGSDPTGFSILLGPDQRANMYPLVAPLGGDRRLVHAPTLLPQCLHSGEIGGGAGELLVHRCDPEGYVWLGVPGETDEGAVVGPPSSPLAEVLATAAPAAQDALASRLGPSGARTGRIGVVVHDAAPASLVAHVVRDGAVIFEARPGFEPLISEDVARTQVRPLMRHEMFHRWNMSGATADETVPAWIYEGSAEYVGGLLSLLEGDFSAMEHDWVLSQSLNQCRDVLGDVRLPEAEENRRTNYDCGRVAAWLLDLDLRRQGADIFDFWRLLLDGATRSEHRYSYVQWRQVLEDQDWATPALDQFLMHGASDALPGVISTQGARVVYEPTPYDVRRAVLEPILAANCTSESYGFFDEPGRATLDADTLCPALPPQAVILSVAGFNLFSDPQAALRAVMEQCAGGQEVTVGLAEGGSARLQCAPLSSPAPSFRVEESGVGGEAES